MIKSLLFTFAILFSFSNAFAQQNEWELFQEVDGVKFYKKEASCEFNNAPNQKWYLIKVENTNSYAVKAEWDKHMWYNNECANCDSYDETTPEDHQIVELEAGNSVEGKCEIPAINALSVFIEFTVYQSNVKLTKFQLDNLLVVKK